MTSPSRLILAFVALGLASCGKIDPNLNKTDKDDTGGGDCDGTSFVTSPEDQTATTGATVPLSAEGTTCACGNDDATTLTWSLESAPVDSEVDTTSLNTADPLNISMVPDVPGTYVIGVTVTDNCGGEPSTELAIVTVASSNSAPIADCGDNQIAEVDQRVDLDGSDSRDPEGAELSYGWALSSVPDCSGLQPGTESMYNGSTVSPSVVPDCPGVYVVALVVSDGEQWSEADYCSITVGAGNELPIADAGVSVVESACAAQDYQLNGYGSYDPEGEDLSYQWSVVSVPAGSASGDDDFSDATAPNTRFAWDVNGTYTFQLQVFDGENYSVPDIVTVTFVDASSNNSPTANAGDDQTISEATECETASYEWTCEDCPAVVFDLDGSASDDAVDGDDLDFYWTEATGELSIAAPYSAITTATTPTMASEYNVATTRSWDVELTVSDCADSDSDNVTLTYTCTGEYSP